MNNRKVVKDAKIEANPVADRANSGPVVYASDVSESARKAAEKRPTAVKKVRRGLEDSGGFTSEERAASFRIAFALSLTDTEAKDSAIVALFPKTLAIREKIVKAKIEAGKGYTAASLTDTAKAIGSGVKESGFTAFRLSGTRYPILETDGKLKLYIVREDGAKFPNLPESDLIS